MSKSNNRIANRMNIIFFLSLLFSFFLIGKIFYLQNIEVETITKSTIEAVKNIEVESPRGNIYSDNGDLIVSTVVKYELRWDSKTPSSSIYSDNISDLSHLINEITSNLESLDKNKIMEEAKNLFQALKENSFNAEGTPILRGNKKQMTELSIKKTIDILYDMKKFKAIN